MGCTTSAAKQPTSRHMDAKSAQPEAFDDFAAEINEEIDSLMFSIEENKVCTKTLPARNKRGDDALNVDARGEGVTKEDTSTTMAESSGPSVDGGSNPHTSTSIDESTCPRVDDGNLSQVDPTISM